MAWRKLHVRNDWGFITVHAGKLKLTDMGINTDLDEQPPRVYPGIYLVMWPDGTEEDVVVSNQVQYEDVSEQGRCRTVTNQIPVIVVHYNGTDLMVELAKSRCKVWVTKEDRNRGYMGDKPK